MFLKGKRKRTTNFLSNSDVTVERSTCITGRSGKNREVKIPKEIEARVSVGRVFPKNLKKENGKNSHDLKFLQQFTKK